MAEPSEYVGLGSQLGLGFIGTLVGLEGSATTSSLGAGDSVHLETYQLECRRPDASLQGHSHPNCQNLPNPQAGSISIAQED